MLEFITWIDRNGTERSGAVVGRGHFAVDRGEEFEVIPSHSPSVRVFIPTSAQVAS